MGHKENTATPPRVIEVKKPEDFLRKIMDMLLREFDLPYVHVQVPSLNLKVEATKGEYAELVTIQKRTCMLELGKMGKIPAKDFRTIERHVELLDVMIEYIIYWDGMYKRVVEGSNLLRLLNKILRHDILNDFNAIQLSIETYLEVGDRNLLKSVLERIQKSIKFIKNVEGVEELVDFKELKQLRLSYVLAEVLGKYDAKIKVSGDGIVKATEVLTSVFDNLIQNAVKHGKASEVYIKIKKKGNFYEIKISDNGKGIPEEVKESVFDEGFSYGGGSGLGLYISKKIVEFFGGEMFLEKARPATFVIRLRGGD